MPGLAPFAVTALPGGWLFRTVLCAALAPGGILKSPTGATRFRRKLPLLEGMPGPVRP